MHFFVAGATGFIGSHFVNKALCLNHKVTALSRKSSNPKIPFIKEPIWCKGSLVDDWSESLKECDVFINFAATGVVNNSDNWAKCLEVNFIQNEILFRNAIESGIKKFLICGSCFEYGSSGDDYLKIPVDAPLKPIGAYAYSKAIAGLSSLNIAKNKNLRFILARLFHIYGKGENPRRFWPSLVKAAKEGVDFQMTQGNQLRNFTKVEDAVSILLDLCKKLDYIEKGGLIKNVGSKNNLQLKEFAFREWTRLKAKANIKLGSYPYKENEVMSYIPYLDI